MINSQNIDVDSMFFLKAVGFDHQVDPKKGTGLWMFGRWYPCRTPCILKTFLYQQVATSAVFPITTFGSCSQLSCGIDRTIRTRPEALSWSRSKWDAWFTVPLLSSSDLISNLDIQWYTYNMYIQKIYLDFHIQMLITAVSSISWSGICCYHSVNFGEGQSVAMILCTAAISLQEPHPRYPSLSNKKSFLTWDW